MIKLVQNELIKIFYRVGTYVMIGLLLLMVLITGGFMKYQESQTLDDNQQSWKNELTVQNEQLKKDLAEMKGHAPKEQIEYLEKQIAINEYRIKNNLSPNENYSMWDFVTDASPFIEFAGLFTIIIAAGIVASEFNWGTIKLLLIRPISRTKILISKYITVILFALFMLFVLFSFATFVGAVLFGVPDQSSPYLLYTDGKVIEQPIVVYLITTFLLKYVNTIMLATMAFMISAVFRNNSLAIGLSLFLMLMGSQITRMIAIKYDWAKYLLFANTDLMQYIEGTPIVEGMTMTFSVTMLIIYFVLFQALAHYVFQKRDVAA